MTHQPPRVFVSLGTDVHPFERLVSWVERWPAASDPALSELVLQVGHTRVAHWGSSHAWLTGEEMSQHMSSARAVVSHGGPATIALSRRFGKVPIVLARRSELGEHVDDHQVAFTDRLAATGRIVLVRSEVELHDQLDRALHDPSHLRCDPEVADVTATVTHFDRLVSAEVARRQASETTGAAGDDETVVLSIAGWGRSGSTLLERMLGQVPEVAAAGELRDVFLRGPLENRRCGCGAPFRSCPHWQAVGDVAFGGWDAIDAAALHRTRVMIDRPWMTPALLAPRLLPPAARAELSRYVDAHAALVAAHAQVSGASVVIDSSKIATHVLLTRLAAPGRVRVVHLVRDSRGVVHSWQKTKSRCDRTEQGDDALLRYGTLGAALRYDLYNGLAEAVAAAARMPRLFLRYEDLLGDPAATLESVLSFVGRTPSADSLAHLEPGRVVLSPHHTVDGNPVRFRTGAVELQPDEAWRSSMPAGRRALVTALTAPLLARYGYLRRANTGHTTRGSEGAGGRCLAGRPRERR